MEHERISNANVVAIINKNQQGDISYCFPETINDQQKIASFLDSKTTEIDQTIFKDKQLIELLKEKYAQTNNKKIQGKIYETIGYFENNKGRMNSYKQHKEKGLCIGSGAIESANKYVMQRRIKLPG